MKKSNKTITFRNYMHLHVQQTTRMQVQEDRTKYNRKKQKDSMIKNGYEF